MIYTYLAKDNIFPNEYNTANMTRPSLRNNKQLPWEWTQICHLKTKSWQLLKNISQNAFVTTFTCTCKASLNTHTYFVSNTTSWMCIHVHQEKTIICNKCIAGGRGFIHENINPSASFNVPFNSYQDWQTYTQDEAYDKSLNPCRPAQSGAVADLKSK